VSEKLSAQLAGNNAVPTSLASASPTNAGAARYPPSRTSGSQRFAGLYRVADLQVEATQVAIHGQEAAAVVEPVGPLKKLSPVSIALLDSGRAPACRCRPGCPCRCTGCATGRKHAAQAEGTGAAVGGGHVLLPRGSGAHVGEGGHRDGKVVALCARRVTWASLARS